MRAYEENADAVIIPGFVTKLAPSMLEVGVWAPTGVEPGVAAFGVVSGWFHGGGDVSPEPVGVTPGVALIAPSVEVTPRLGSTVVWSAAAYVGVGPDAVRGFIITVLGVVCEADLLVAAAPACAVWNVYKLTFYEMFNVNTWQHALENVKTNTIIDVSRT